MGLSDGVLCVGVFVVGFDLWCVIVVIYFLFYGCYSVGVYFCGYGFLVVGVDGRFGLVVVGLCVIWWSEGSGILLGNGVVLVDGSVVLLVE